MSGILKIQNDGPLIAETNFWATDHANHGLFYVSINAGAFRILIPKNCEADIPEMIRGVKHVVVSMLPKDRWKPKAYCLEIMFEDSSDSPWACQISPGQTDRAPTDESVGIAWKATLWTEQNNGPALHTEFPAYFQIVPKIPWLKSIEKS
jgi:hypothetical protein